MKAFSRGSLSVCACVFSCMRAASPHECVFARLAQRRGHVELLVQVRDLLGDVAHLDLMLQTVTVALHLQQQHEVYNRNAQLH